MRVLEESKNSLPIHFALLDHDEAIGHIKLSRCLGTSYTLENWHQCTLRFPRAPRKFVKIQTFIFLIKITRVVNFDLLNTMVESKHEQRLETLNYLG